MQQEDKIKGLLLLLQPMLTGVGPLQNINIGHPLFDGLFRILIIATSLSEPDGSRCNAAKGRHIYVRIVELLPQSGPLRQRRLPRRTRRSPGLEKRWIC